MIKRFWDWFEAFCHYNTDLENATLLTLLLLFILVICFVSYIKGISEED